MFKKLLCLMTAFAGVSFAMEQSFGPGTGSGNHDIVVPPLVHTYNCEYPSAAFWRGFYSPSGEPVVLAIQSMSAADSHVVTRFPVNPAAFAKPVVLLAKFNDSAKPRAFLVNANRFQNPTASYLPRKEQYAFKPQWFVFNEDVAQKFDQKDEKGRYVSFSIGTYADCSVKVDNDAPRHFSSKVYFHNPRAVSPDVMHLGFTNDSKSRLIEYNAKYSNGFGSEFAKSKDGTALHGFVLLFNDKDMGIIKKCLREDNISNDDLFDLIEKTSLANRLGIIKGTINLFTPSIRPALPAPSVDALQQSDVHPRKDSAINVLTAMMSGERAASPEPESQYKSSEEAVCAAVAELIKPKCGSTVSEAKQSSAPAEIAPKDQEMMRNAAKLLAAMASAQPATTHSQIAAAQSSAYSKMGQKQPEALSRPISPRPATPYSNGHLEIVKYLNETQASAQPAASVEPERLTKHLRPTTSSKIASSRSTMEQKQPEALSRPISPRSATPYSNGHLEIVKYLNETQASAQPAASVEPERLTKHLRPTTSSKIASSRSTAIGAQKKMNLIEAMRKRRNPETERPMASKQLTPVEIVKNNAIANETEIENRRLGIRGMQSRIMMLNEVARLWGIDTTDIQDTAKILTQSVSSREFWVTYLSQLSQVLLEHIQ